MERYTALYARVSSTDQNTDSQTQELRDYAAQNGLYPVRLYVDKITGSTTDRPALDELRQDIRLGQIGSVVVWKIDRLSRNLRQGINLICEFLDADVRLIAVRQGFDFSGPLGKLICSLLLGLAEMERANIREAQQRGIKKALRKNCPKCKTEGIKTAVNRKRRFAEFRCPACGMTWTGKHWGGQNKGKHTALTPAICVQIRDLRHINKLSQPKIAKLLGISLSSVCRFYRAEREREAAANSTPKPAEICEAPETPVEQTIC